jgi:hypothetical protein
MSQMISAREQPPTIPSSAQDCPQDMLPLGGTTEHLSPGTIMGCYDSIGS